MSRKDKEIVQRAQERFREAVEWESSFRMRFRDDIKFLYADSDNQDQWPASVRSQRAVAGQIMVTINKTHTHWLHVVNQAKENRPQVSVSPTGDQATYDSAQIFEQIIRRIEYISDAETAYDVAVQNQVGAGIGYWRVVTDYTDQDSFDQDIYIKQIADPLSVYMDPHIKNQDGSDAKYAFIFDELPRAEAEKKYPNVIKRTSAFGGMAENWMRADSIRVAEYYEKTESKEWLYAVPSDDGEITMARESNLGPEGSAMLKLAYEQRNDIQRRRVSNYSVDKYLLVGNDVAERSVWAGKYIPIVRVVGEETVIENRLDRKGLTRYLKDGQRMYNYNAAAAIEFGALQSKMPYMAAVEAIEGLENYWATANNQNHAFLPYNHMDEAGNPIPAPQRQQPPTSAPVYMEGMQTAEHEMMMASGQYEATFSAQGNEISGVSIEQRQKQGERVTYHYQDNLAKAIRFTGKILIDLIPKIYDTRRILRIMDEAGEEHSIQIDPNSRQALTQNDDEAEAKVKAIFNPSVGQYEVIATVGPNFETRRREAFNAMTNMLTSNEALAPVIGDLYMANADFPAADKLQERMRNWIKSVNPGVLGDVDQQAQALQQQLQQAAAIIQQLQQALHDKTVQHQLEAKRVDMDALNHLALRMENDNKQVLDAFKAETDRLKTLAPTMGQDALEPIIRKAVAEILRAPNPDAAITPDPTDPANLYASGITDVLAPIEESQPQSAQ